MSRLPALATLHRLEPCLQIELACLGRQLCDICGVLLSSLQTLSGGDHSLLQLAAALRTAVRRCRVPRCLCCRCAVPAVCCPLLAAAAAAAAQLYQRVSSLACMHGENLPALGTRLEGMLQLCSRPACAAVPSRACAAPWLAASAPQAAGSWPPHAPAPGLGMLLGSQHALVAQPAPSCSWAASAWAAPSDA